MQLFQNLGVAYLALLVTAAGADWYRQPSLGDLQTAPAPRALPRASSHKWFNEIKPYCNQVEAGVMIPRSPPPQDREGWGYAAACYALAGKVDKADEILAKIRNDSDRKHAAGIVFRIGHPVADAGDDDAAGPIMRLVVKYQPTNYMALYHAGISEYNLGEHRYAKEHLQRFLEIYTTKDGWRANGTKVLAQIEEREAALR